MTDAEYRELDRQVALNVMGDWNDDGWWVSADGSKISCADEGPAHYSTEFAAMGRLLEKLSKEVGIEVGNSPSGWTVGIYSHTDINKLHSIGPLPSLPLAVALVATMAYPATDTDCEPDFVVGE